MKRKESQYSPRMFGLEIKRESGYYINDDSLIETLMYFVFRGCKPPKDINEIHSDENFVINDIIKRQIYENTNHGYFTTITKEKIIWQYNYKNRKHVLEIKSIKDDINSALLSPSIVNANVFDMLSQMTEHYMPEILERKQQQLKQEQYINGSKRTTNNVFYWVGV